MQSAKFYLFEHVHVSVLIITIIAKFHRCQFAYRSIIISMDIMFLHNLRPQPISRSMTGHSQKTGAFCCDSYGYTKLRQFELSRDNILGWWCTHIQKALVLSELPLQQKQHFNYPTTKHGRRHACRLCNFDSCDSCQYYEVDKALRRWCKYSAVFYLF